MAPSKQLCFAFLDSVRTRFSQPVADSTDTAVPEEKSRSRHEDGSDPALEQEARGWLRSLGLQDGARQLRVEWNPRMRSTAGYAKWPKWTVELNPRLREFDGQTGRTLKHELAHLIAHARAGRRRIEPHGAEWRKACADLGIPREKASHALPLPRRRQARKFLYTCPSCGTTAGRVRKFKRHTACLACCRKHNGGRYDARFQFVLKRGAGLQPARDAG